MGVIRFAVQPSSQLSAEAAQRACFVGQDLIPWLASVHWDANRLSLERASKDSGCLRIPWRVVGRGELTISTGTLVEREAPYLLEVELARGKLNQLRHSLCDWQTLGLAAPGDMYEDLHATVALFSSAVTRQHDPIEACGRAQQALARACELADRLAALYCEQASAARHRQASKLDVLLASSLGRSHMDRATSKLYRRAFNAAVVPLAWPVLEAKEGAYDWTLTDHQTAWCEAHHLKTIGGPLVQLDRGGLPDWLYLWDGDFSSLAGFITAHVRAVTQRLHGKIDLWHAVARANIGGALSLSEEETLHLTVLVIEAIRHIDAETPVVISFDQPWADYMGRRDTDLAPWHFADALARAGLGLAGLMLEINLGYAPGGTAVRDSLDIIRQLDLWSMFGLPLLVNLTAPSDAGPDPLARPGLTAWEAPVAAGWTPQTQRQLAERWLALLVARPNVRVVTWNQLRDGEPHEFPHGGLIDPRGEAKPALESLAAIRRAHLH